MKKIALIDYIGYCDKNGDPVGHPLKVIRENRKILLDYYNVEVVAPKGYIKALHIDGEQLELSNYTRASCSSVNIFSNIKRMISSFINIHAALRKSKAEILWFCNVDQFLFMYLGVFGFHKKKIMITLFAKEYDKKYHNYFLQKVLTKIELLITSNPEACFNNVKNIFIPDYLYSQQKYEQYVSKNKEQKIVCVGTMNRSKKIKELVQIFNKIDYPVEIYGLFYDDEYYKEILKLKKKHIKIINKYLDYKEYLMRLGESKFCILPYSDSAYSNFTSGVILESIFLSTIPITCESLLTKMNIKGISYKSMNELQEINWYSDYENIILSNKEVIRTVYENSIYIHKLIYRIESIMKCEG